MRKTPDKPKLRSIPMYSMKLSRSWKIKIEKPSQTSRDRLSNQMQYGVLDGILKPTEY